jgi:hypothetical protein
VRHRRRGVLGLRVGQEAGLRRARDGVYSPGMAGGQDVRRGTSAGQRVEGVYGLCRSTARRRETRSWSWFGASAIVIWRGPR